MGTLHENLCTFATVPRSVLLRMRNVSDKSCKLTYTLCSTTFFENCAVYVIMCKNMLQPDKPQTTVSFGACALHAR